MSEDLELSCCDHASPSVTSASSCLRSPDSSRKNRIFKVSFPEEERNLITGYLEPANPWEYAENVTRDDLIATYKASCEKHGTRPLASLLQQLQTVDIEAVRSDCLDLKGELLAAPICETLEEVLKRVQFKNINLESTALDDEGSVALFDMMEYYESATHLNISSNKEIGVRGWQACSRMIKKTCCLEHLDARNVTLNEQYMPILSRALRIGTHLQVLKLENCGLSGRPIIILAAALKLNTGLRELYLADNGLNVTDAAQLGALLRANLTLQLLDVSNNNIQDVGVGHILDGLIDQTPQAGGGLCILVVWNNHLTRNASKHLARALARSKTLEILNVGHNVLTNESLHAMKDSLQQNRTLLRIGMQSTHITCEGAVALAECIADNPVIQRIDLRDNNVQVAGLMALTLSMKVNRSVTQLDLDDIPKKKMESADALKQYRKLVQEIREYSSRNEQTSPTEEDDVIEESESTPERRVRLSSATSRKISLTCETLMRVVSASQDVEQHPHLLTEPRRSGGRLRSPAPSPVPSPVSSPIPSPSRNRFQVSRVNEISPSPSPSPSSSLTLSSSPSRFFASPGMSRFRVTLVEPSAKHLPAPKPIISSPSGNNITVGFSFKLNDKEVTINTSIPESCNVVTSSNPVISNSGSIFGSKVTAENLASSRSNEILKEETPSKLNSSKSAPLLEEPNITPHAMDAPEDTADLEVRELMDRPDCKSMWDQSSHFSTAKSQFSLCNATVSQVCSTTLSTEQVVAPSQTCSAAFRAEPQPTMSLPRACMTARVSEQPCRTQSQPAITAEPQPCKVQSQVPSITPVKETTQLCKSCPKFVIAEEPLPNSSAFSVSSQPCSAAENVALSQPCPTTLSGDQSQLHSPVFSALSQQPTSSTPSETPSQPPLDLFPCDSKKADSKPNAQRSRKISWISPVEPHSSEAKPTSSLERLLGLFQHPSSFFNKTQPQYKATTVIVNQQPVANSNASFLLTAGPLAGAAKEVCAQQIEEERLSSPDEEPETDVLNNNSRDSQGASGDSPRLCLRCSSEEREQIRTRQSEDENLNLSKSCVTDDSDKRLWCAGVCGAGVVKSWAQSSSPCASSSFTGANLRCASQEKESENKIGSRSPDPPPCSLVKEDVDSRLYVSVMKNNTPANGMNVTLLSGSSSSALWPDSSNLEMHLPVAAVRLVGGGNLAPSVEQASTGRGEEMTDTKLCVQHVEEAEEAVSNVGTHADP